MHHCLEVLEILRNVFLQLENRDLCSVTLTCRDFKQLALQVLWQDLEDLSPVIRNFPPDAWKVHVQKKENFYRREIRVWVYTLTRSLRPQDWNAVLPYLPLIRTIDTSSDSDRDYAIEVSDEFYRSMLSTFPGERLFPNLRCFSFKDTTTTDGVLEFINSSFGPRMKTLCVGFTEDSSEQTRCSFMRAIPVLCPSIKIIDLVYPSLYFPAISEVICQFHHLEELAVPELSAEALIHVSQLPRLRRFNLDDIGIGHLPTLPHPAFPALESLIIFGGTPSFHTGIHAAITSTNLRSYEGHFSGPAMAEEWQQLLAQVGVTGPQEIQFGCEPKPRNPNDPCYVITSDMLKPILAFRNLTVLNLITVFTFDLDDDFVLNLAKACPELNWVDFGSSWSSGRRSRATLASYAHLIQYCPKLRILGLVIDASGADRNLQVNPAEGVKNFLHYDKEDCTPQFTLRVGDSYITYPLAVAAFLSSFVDSGAQDCIRICAANDSPDNIIKAWESVPYLIALFVAARAQERRNPATGPDKLATRGSGENQDVNKKVVNDADGRSC